MYDYEQHDVYTTLYLRYMIVMLERNAVLPTIAGNYGLCQMVPICSKCWVVLFAFLAKYCQRTNYHTKPLTDMRFSRLWENTQTKTLYMWQTYSTLGHLVTSHWSAVTQKQDKTNRSSQKKHMQKSKIYHIHNLILYSPWLSMVVTWATNKKHMSSPVGSMLPTRIGSCWILWTDIAIDHLVFPMFIAVFFCEMAKTVNFTISIYIT